MGRSAHGKRHIRTESLPVAPENSDSCVSMVEPTKDRMRNNFSEPRDRTSVGRVLPERNVSSHFVIIAGIFRENSAKVLCVDHDQRISALALDRPDQAFNISVLPGCTDALSLSRMRYFGALSQGNASVICRASHSAVGFRVTAVHNSRLRRWLRTRNA